MEDLNENCCLPLSPPPAGSSLWIPLSGRLISYGQSRYHSFPDYFCPHVITAGRGVVEVDGKHYDMAPGDMFTLWPSSEILYHDFPETPWQFYYFHLSGEDMKAYVHSLGLTREKPVFRPENPEAVIAAFDHIWRSMKGPSPGGHYEVLSQMFILPKWCGKNAAAAEPEDTLVEHALELIHSSRNPSGTNVNELCERLQVSRVTLYRKFTGQLHLTPSDYIISHRMKTARELLLTSGRTVGEIAALAGFNSEKYFLKMFKTRFGLTPSEFRRREKA